MLSIIDNGIDIQNGKLRYAWFEIEKDASRFFRCVALRELTIIPAAEREDYDLLGKQWTAVRGLHNAGVNFVYAAMGIYDPDHIGVVQYFGAAGEAAAKADAAAQALTGMSTVEAVLANFPQSRLGAPNQDWFRWYLDFITSRGRNIAAVLGHPDPREGKHDSAVDGSSADDASADLAREQNEILFRGLSRLQENFVFQVLAEHVARPLMTKTLIRIAEAASNVASRRKGSMGIGFSLGIPIMAALSQGHTAGVGAGQGTSQSVQDGVSQGWGSSHMVGSSHAVGHSVTDGVSQSTGESQGTSQGTSHSVSDGTSSSHTSGHSQSYGGGWSKSDGGNGGATLGFPGIGSISGGYCNRFSVGGFVSSGSM